MTGQAALRTVVGNQPSLSKRIDGYWRCRWGCIPNRVNQRCTVLFETPVCSTMVRSVQCVPLDGVDCKAVLTTSATVTYYLSETLQQHI